MVWVSLLVIVCLIEPDTVRNENVGAPEKV
jgi:hypothetical protein